MIRPGKSWSDWPRKPSPRDRRIQPCTGPTRPRARRSRSRTRPGTRSAPTRPPGKRCPPDTWSRQTPRSCKSWRSDTQSVPTSPRGNTRRPNKPFAWPTTTRTGKRRRPSTCQRPSQSSSPRDSRIQHCIRPAKTTRHEEPGGMWEARGGGMQTELNQFRSRTAVPRQCRGDGVMIFQKQTSSLLFHSFFTKSKTTHRRQQPACALQ